jgi:hypothetical protein
MPHPKELPIPRPCANEEKAAELARIWMSGRGGQHVSLSTGVVGNPNGWGVLLVNLARNVADAYKQTLGLDPDQTLAGIKAAFEKEWNSPTTRATGEVVKNVPRENPK